MQIYKIFLPQFDQVIEHSNQDSLLTSLETAGYPHEFQCRSGYCGACRVKLIDGEVSYPTPPLAFIGKDEILLCCCKVKRDITIQW